MAINMQGGGDVSGGGKWLSDPGTYHVVITDATETPLKRDGNTYDGALFGVTCSVLAGTVGGQENKCVDIIFYNPEGSDTDEKRARAQKTIDKFCIAANVTTLENVLAKKPYSIDVEKLKAHQLVVEFVKSNDGKYLRSWDNFHHIDDEDVKSVPKKKEWLAVVKPQFRRTAKQPTTPTAPVSAPAVPAPVPAADIEAGNL